MFLRKYRDELLAIEAQPAASLYLPTHVAGRAHTRFYQGSRWTLAEVEGIGLPQGVGAIAGITQHENTLYAAPTGRHTGGLDKAQSFGEAPEELRKSELIELLQRIAAKLHP